jgi:hypothetical protein
VGVWLGVVGGVAVFEGVIDGDGVNVGVGGIGGHKLRSHELYCKIE